MSHGAGPIKRDDARRTPATRVKPPPLEIGLAAAQPSSHTPLNAPVAATPQPAKLRKQRSHRA